MRVNGEGGALPRVSEWFVAEPVAAGITRIKEPFVHPWVRGNAWYVQGSNQSLLIDTGLGAASMQKFVQAIATTEPVVVLTHAHLDHMGSAHEFQRCWGHRLESWDPPHRASLHGPVLAAELGVTEDVPALLISAVPTADYNPDSYQLRPARITRWLDDGDQINLGDRRLTVLHLPGHTPGSIALFDDHDGALFSGDVVYDGVLLDDTVGADRDSYRQACGDYGPWMCGWSTPDTGQLSTGPCWATSSTPTCSSPSKAGTPAQCCRRKRPVLGEGSRTATTSPSPSRNLHYDHRPLNDHAPCLRTRKPPLVAAQPTATPPAG